jgi:hypothetical protein
VKLKINVPKKKIVVSKNWWKPSSDKNGGWGERRQRCEKKVTIHNTGNRGRWDKEKKEVAIRGKVA